MLVFFWLGAGSSGLATSSRIRFVRRTLSTRVSLMWVGWSRGCGPIRRLGETERAASPVDSAQESAAGAVDSPISSAEAEAAAQEGAISRSLFTIVSTGDNKAHLVRTVTYG